MFAFPLHQFAQFYLGTDVAGSNDPLYLRAFHESSAADNSRNRYQIAYVYKGGR
jgi:hypothetical protein